MSKLLVQIQEQLNKRAVDIEVKEKSIIERLKMVKEKERLEISLTRLAVEKEKEKMLKKLEDKEKEVELLAKLNHEKSYELKRQMEQFDVKQKVAAERKVLDDEQLETREKELKEKEVIFKAKAEEIETREKELDEKEENLKAKAEELELKLGSVQGQTVKRSRRLALLAEEGNEAKNSAKRHRHGDEEDKETESSPEEEEQEEEEVATSEPVPINCVESEFNDFKKTINSFEVGQLWELYDRKDAMPRLYGRIYRVIKSRSCIQVKWVKPKDEQETVSLACGKFQYGILETKHYSTFSHQMPRNIRGSKFVAVYPRKGEIWAMFKDWSENWSNDHQLHKQPYKYEFVEILVEFDENLGVSGLYLEKVDGFVSVFKHQEQQGVSFTVPPGGMNRFSHKIPFFKLTGEEKQEVPVGSFELDPAALPSSMLKEVKEETERQSEEERVEANQDGSTKNVPIVILD